MNGSKNIERGAFTSQFYGARAPAAALRVPLLFPPPSYKMASAPPPPTPQTPTPQACALVTPAQGAVGVQGGAGALVAVSTPRPPPTQEGAGAGAHPARTRAPSVRLAPPSARTSLGRRPAALLTPAQATAFADALAAVELAYARPVQPASSFRGPGGVLPPLPPGRRGSSGGEVGRGGGVTKQAKKRVAGPAPPPPAPPAQQPASPLAPPPLTSTAALASTAAAFFPPWTSVEVSEEEVNDDAVSWLDGMAADLEAYLGEEEAAAAAAVAG